MSGPRWVDVGALTDLSFGPGAAVCVEGHWLAVFRVDGGLRAIDNACPHASAPLCDGSVVDGKVVCFLHCWQFDLATGACDVGAAWNVRAYDAREELGRVQVLWPGKPA